MLTQAQIHYYNSLSDEKQKILIAAAYNTVAEAEFSFQEVAYIFLKRRIAQRDIDPIMEDAVKHELFLAEKRWVGHSRYTVLPDFLLFIFKETTVSQKVWEEIVFKGKHSFRDANSSEKCFRNAVHALMNDPEEYAKQQAVFLNRFDNVLYAGFAALLADDFFTKYLKQVSPDIIKTVVRQIVRSTIYRLEPFPVLEEKIAIIAKEANIPNLKEAARIKLDRVFWSGDFAKALAIAPDILDFKAIKALIDGDLKSTFLFFGKLLRAQQQQSNNKVPFLAQSYMGYFYAVALLSDMAQARLVFEKLISWVDKQKDADDFSFYYKFLAVALDQTDVQKEKLAELKLSLKNNILREEIDSTSVIDILIYHLVGEKLDTEHAPKVLSILTTAFEAGYLLTAHEAAYVATKWFPENAAIVEVFEKMSKMVGYQPVISRLNRQTGWEKSLELLLGFKTKATAKKTTENATRVVYYFDPKSQDIQPVLQTRQSKGWSGGRKIACETFHSGKTKGMVEQDYRAAKCVKFSQSFYGTEYYYDRQIFVELIGHPYIFLAGSEDVPVEFISGQVIISVDKTKNGLQLKTDLKVSEKYPAIAIEKETNTRYKIFTLTENQRRILQIINGEKLVIPDAGQKKLTEVLGNLAAEGFAVHSDLAANIENTNLEIKEVKSDSRIRVQILPFGDGLKAELFAKPFGDRPPYCKAGKGGKVLISNDKDTQLQVRRDFARETENEQALLNEIQTIETLNETDGLLSFDNPLDSLYLLDMLRDKEKISVVEWAEGVRYKLRGSANINNLRVNIKSGISWFDLDGELRVDENTVVSLQKLLQLTAKGHNRFIELSNGDFLALSDRLKKQLDALRMFSDVEKNAIRLNKFASVGLEDFFEEMKSLKGDAQWKEFQANIETARNETVEIPANLNVELREYQTAGFHWMSRLASWNAGACLADDMGLGKTIQTLAILLHRAKLGAALVVCPVSVIGNWMAEAAKFAPSLNFKTLGDSSTDRKAVIAGLGAGDVLLTSYGLLQSEEELFIEPKFATAVLDEAHVIKNFATKTSKAIMQLRADFRLALTGTPLQNHLGELWNLFNFVNPGLLGNMQHFKELSPPVLKRLISPFILRRTKSAVLDELPPKTEIVKKIALSSEEIAFYESLRRQALENLANADEGKHIQVLAEITKLRLASCNSQMIDSKLNIPSSKLAAFLEIIAELKENNHRALVFSQFVKHLDIVRAELDKQKIVYQYIDGSSTQKEREESVKKFQSGEGDLFLISLKAGGLGLNLTAADYVIHLDPWWNPAVEDQASDRAHRIGQTRPVTIYRLVAEGTIEEKILQLHATKRDMAENLLEGSDTAAKLSVEEMIALIKSTASIAPEANA